MKDNNPKAARALLDGKAPMEYIPWGPLAGVARVLEKGALKYGARNWRKEKISCSTYEGAIARHALLEWAKGSDVDPDDGEHPLAHVIACCLLVLDAREYGTLVDDRQRCEVLLHTVDPKRDFFDYDDELPEDHDEYAAVRGSE